MSSRGFRQRVLYLEEELLPASLIGACVDAPALPESRASPTWPALWGSAHLVRAFTSEFTISPHGCLIGCRLDRAHRLLLAGLPVTEVAIDAGLHDQAHLTRTFGRFLLTTPGQYQHSPQHRAVHPCERHRDDQSCTRRPRRVREIIDHVTGIPDALEPPFSTKIAVIVREDLASWQRLNVTAFLSATIAAADPQLIGAPYQDGDDGTHLPLPGMPVLIFEATAETLATVRGRAVARNLDAAIHTGDMFHTGYAAANQATTATVPAAELDLVGLAVHGPENPLDRTINEARLHP